MKKIIACALLMAASGGAYATECFRDTITHVAVGQISNDLGGDSGNAIYFVTSGGALWKMEDYLNMNDPAGKFMYTQLMLSVVGGYKIIGYRNYNGGKCEGQINQLTLMN